MSWALKVGTGLRSAAPEVGVTPFALPELPDRKPYDVEFADWDGDGAVDALVAGSYLNPERTAWVSDIYWLRNTATRGTPTFDPPARLLTAPAQAGGWKYDGYAVVPRGRPGRQDLVVSVSKDWDRKPGGGWTNTSRLVLFRRKSARRLSRRSGGVSPRGLAPLAQSIGPVGQALLPAT